MPALCLVCGAILDAGGMGQCATHTAACGGDTGVYFLLQVLSTSSFIIIIIIIIALYVYVGVHSVT